MMQYQCRFKECILVLSVVNVILFDHNLIGSSSVIGSFSLRKLN